jgi:hypothetical protein
MSFSGDTSTLLTWMLNGLVVATALAGVAVVVCALFVITSRVRSGAPANTAGEVVALADHQRPLLPVGAEAALNAIVELRPDPRNVVVTHRDPTGEVRLYPLTAASDDRMRFNRSA